MPRSFASWWHVPSILEWILILLGRRRGRETRDKRLLRNRPGITSGPRSPGGRGKAERAPGGPPRPGHAGLKSGFAPATQVNRPEDRDLIPGLFLRRSVVAL